MLRSAPMRQSRASKRIDLLHSSSDRRATSAAAKCVMSRSARRFQRCQPLPTPRRNPSRRKPRRFIPVSSFSQTMKLAGLLLRFEQLDLLERVHDDVEAVASAAAVQLIAAEHAFEQARSVLSMPASRSAKPSSRRATPKASASDKACAVATRPCPYAFALMTAMTRELGARRRTAARLWRSAELSIVARGNLTRAQLTETGRRRMRSLERSFRTSCTCRGRSD